MLIVVRFLFIMMFIAISNTSFAQTNLEGKLKHQAKLEVKSLEKALKSGLKSEMKSNGPLSSISVCKSFSASYAKSLAKNNGWNVGRTSLKARNPSNKPAAWEKAILEDFNSQLLSGAPVNEIEYSALVETSGVKEYRFMKAIPTQKMCLACHGKSVSKPVAEKLKKLYPQDLATGYSAGEIRGAFTVSKIVPNTVNRK